MMANVLSTVLDAIQANTDLTKWFRRNACARHGVPWNENQEETVSVNVQHEHHHTGLPTSVSESTNSSTTEENVLQKLVDDSKEKLSKDKSWTQYVWPILGMLLMGGGAGATTGALSNYLFSPEKIPPAQVVPADVGSNSLLQYLEDQGAHLP